MYLATLPNLAKETKFKLYKKTELLVGLPEIKFQVVEALRSYGREHDDSVKKYVYKLLRIQKPAMKMFLELLLY